jgi:hypothetical protein
LKTAPIAFGKFICNARLEFMNGDAACIWRLIDFEMGAIGNKRLEEIEEAENTKDDSA